MRSGSGDAGRRPPPLAVEVAEIARDVLGERLLGAYLHGSHVLGGLRPTSDVDVLAVLDRPSTDDERRRLTERLMEVSGSRATRGPDRPVELTMVVAGDVRPWQYPPREDFQYGDWLRPDYERGVIAGPRDDPDLAPLIEIVLRGEAAGFAALHGPPASTFLGPVPRQDLRRAIVAGIPHVLADLDGDTRNMLLTLARIWLTLETGDIRTKDHAGRWAAARLRERGLGVEALVLEDAARQYVEGSHGEDEWPTRLADVHAAADAAVERIRALTIGASP